MLATRAPTTCSRVQPLRQAPAFSSRPGVLARPRQSLVARAETSTVGGLRSAPAPRPGARAPRGEPHLLALALENALVAIAPGGVRCCPRSSRCPLPSASPKQHPRAWLPAAPQLAL